MDGWMDGWTKLAEGGEKKKAKNYRKDKEEWRERIKEKGKDKE